MDSLLLFIRGHSLLPSAPRPTKASALKLRILRIRKTTGKRGSPRYPPLTNLTSASWIKLPFGTANNPIICESISLRMEVHPSITHRAMANRQSDRVPRSIHLPFSDTLESVGKLLRRDRRPFPHHLKWHPRDRSAATALPPDQQRRCPSMDVPGTRNQCFGPEFVLFRRLEREFRHQFRDSVGNAPE